MDVNVEVLKQFIPPPAGEGIINGTVSTSTPKWQSIYRRYQKVMRLLLSNFIIIIICDVVGYTNTNDGGFMNLQKFANTLILRSGKHCH